MACGFVEFVAAAPQRSILKVRTFYRGVREREGSSDAASLTSSCSHTFKDFRFGSSCESDGEEDPATMCTEDFEVTLRRISRKVSELSSLSASSPKVPTRARKRLHEAPSPQAYAESRGTKIVSANIAQLLQEPEWRL